MKSKNSPIYTTLQITAAVFVSFTCSTHAATKTWDGGAGGTGTELGTAANWNLDALPANSDVLQWNGTATGALNLTYNVAQAAVFNTSPGVSISLTGGQTASLALTGSQTLRLNGSGVTIASGAGAFTLGITNLTVFNGTMAMTNNSTNAATISSGVTFGTTSAGVTTWAFGGTGNWTVNSNLSSTNNSNGNKVTKSGSGTLTMAAANASYTGGTTIGASADGAVLRATATQALGTGSVSFDGTGNGSTARLELSGGISLNNAIGFTARTNNSVAIQNISGNNTLSGLMTLGLGGSNYTIQSDAGSLAITNAGTVSIASGKTLTLQGAGNGSVASVLSSAGGVKKDNAGTWTLTGANNYTGATTISAGTLAFSTNTQSLGSSAFSVADGAGLRVKAASAGTTLLTTAGLTLGTSGTTLLTFDFNGLNTTAALINSGAITNNGTLSFSFVNGGALSNGTHALLDYTTLSGSGALPSGSFSLSPRSNGSISHDTVNTVFNLDVTSDTPKWTGSDGGAWVVGATGANSNWKLITAGTATDYIEGDVALFDDSATGTTAVTINSANVSPLTTTFSNSSSNYALSSSGGFGIATGTLMKSGTGSLTIGNTNTYGGGTTLNAGTLILNSASPIGTGALTVTGGALDSGSGVTLTTNNAQNWNGNFTFTGTANLDMGTGAVTVGGTGTDRSVTVSAGALSIGELKAASHGFIKQGAGTLALSSTGTGTNGSQIGGTLDVAAGTLQFNRTGATGANSGDLSANGLTGSGTITNGGGDERWLIITNASNNTFSGSLANGAAGALGFNKLGAGTMTLSGANSYTGATTVGGGSLVINGANSGAGTNVTLSGTVGLGLGNTQALGSASLITLSGGASVATVTYATNGGDTAYQYTMSSNATLNVVLDRETVGTNVTHNLSTAASGSGLGGGTGSVNFSRGANVSGLATASFDKFNLGGGSGGSTTLNPQAGTNVIIGSVTKSNNNVSQILNLGGVTTGNEITGEISNGAATGVNSIAVSKSNSSTWTLSGTNTYTGATSVTAGKLVVNGNISTSVSTTVSGTGTLGGSGAVGNLVAQSGGTVAPGNSIESLAAGSVSLESGSTYAYELDTQTLGGDLLFSSSTLNITSGAILTLTELASATRSEGDKLTLISYTGAWNNGLFAYLGNTLADDSTFTLGSNTWKFDYNDLTGGTNFAADQTGATGFVTMTVVPEPAAALLGSIGMLALLRRRR